MRIGRECKLATGLQYLSELNYAEDMQQDYKIYRS